MISPPNVLHHWNLSEDEEHHQQSIFRRGECGRGFRLKDKVQFHLYVSASPCGDACIFSPHDTGVEGELTSRPKSSAAESTASSPLSL